MDAIAITDHIKNQPSRKYIGGDHNASYEVSVDKANELGIILIRGGEITREMPPGHLNGLFLTDVNVLDIKTPFQAIEAAAKQGAFIQWNHPGWKAQQPDTCKWWPEHDELYAKGWIHGIEVFNEKEWYPIVIDWCLEKNLAVMANSDIHDVNAHYYDIVHGHRPMTLVFASNRSLESIKEALFDKRSVAYFDNTLVGKEEFLKAIFEASVLIKRINQENRNNENSYLIKNISDIDYLIEFTDDNNLSNFCVLLFISKATFWWLYASGILNALIMRLDMIARMYGVIAVVAIVIVVTGCNDSSDEYTEHYLALGLVEQLTDPNYSFRIKLDDGRKLYPNNQIEIPEGERIVTEYTIIRQKSVSDSTEFIVDFYAIEEVLYKDIIQLTEDIEDSIGNDLVFLDQEDIWISDSFLNVTFQFYGGSVVHYINMVKPYDSTAIDEFGRQVLEFRHNANNDYPRDLLHGIVTFNLESLYQKGDTALNFVVKANTYDTQEYEWEGSYSFANAEADKNIELNLTSISQHIE